MGFGTDPAVSIFLFLFLLLSLSRKREVDGVLSFIFILILKIKRRTPVHRPSAQARSLLFINYKRKSLCWGPYSAFGSILATATPPGQLSGQPQRSQLLYFSFVKLRLWVVQVVQGGEEGLTGGTLFFS